MKSSFQLSNQSSFYCKHKLFVGSKYPINILSKFKNLEFTHQLVQANKYSILLCIKHIFRIWVSNKYHISHILLYSYMLRMDPWLQVMQRATISLLILAAHVVVRFAMTRVHSLCIVNDGFSNVHFSYLSCFVSCLTTRECAACSPVLPFSKLNKMTFGYFDPELFF